MSACNTHRCLLENDKDEYHIHIKDTANDVVISDHCNNLINAGGALDHWCRPDIAGLDNYKGSLLHTTNWDETIELQGKHVGLIDMGHQESKFYLRFEMCSKVATLIRNPA